MILRTAPGARTQAAAARPGPSRALVATACALAVPFSAVALGWMLGRLVRDRWASLQMLFWMPALAAALAAGAAWLILWIAGGRSRAVRWWRRGCGAGALLALAVAAWNDVGWRGWPADPAAVRAAAGERAPILVTHWNARWPGREALASGQALAPALGDITVISNPGSLLRTAVRELWLPAGWQARDFGPLAVVVAPGWTLAPSRMLGYERFPLVGYVWLAWVVVERQDGLRLQILVADLPSAPEVARGEVARRASAMLGRSPELPAPDLLLGDLNTTPGSVVWDALAPRNDAAPPWRASGWLGSYPRESPALRIDAMLAGPALEWVRYRTLDLGFGAHRAQQGIFVATPAAERAAGSR